MLIVCIFPVIAGCVIIWKSTWSHRAAAPVVGYSIIGAFGAVVSLVISVGMANVAGATKKSAMAAAIFVAYCVGNIVGPLLVRSENKSRHYPELWTGLIIRFVVFAARRDSFALTDVYDPKLLYHLRLVRGAILLTETREQAPGFAPVERRGGRQAFVQRSYRQGEPLL